LGAWAPAVLNASLIYLTQLSQTIQNVIALVLPPTWPPPTHSNRPQPSRPGVFDLLISFGLDRFLSFAAPPPTDAICLPRQVVESAGCGLPQAR